MHYTREPPHPAAASLFDTFLDALGHPLRTSCLRCKEHKHKICVKGGWLLRLCTPCRSPTASLQAIPQATGLALPPTLDNSDPNSPPNPQRALNIAVQAISSGINQAISTVQNSNGQMGGSPLSPGPALPWPPQGPPSQPSQERRASPQCLRAQAAAALALEQLLEVRALSARVLVDSSGGHASA